MGSPPFRRPAQLDRPRHPRGRRSADGREGLRELLHDAHRIHAGLGLHRASEGATRRAISRTRNSPAGRHRRALSAAAMDRGGLREAQTGRSTRGLRGVPRRRLEPNRHGRGARHRDPPAPRRSSSSERVCALGAVAAPSGATPLHGALPRACSRVPVQHVAIPNALLRTRGKPSCDANLTVATGIMAAIGDRRRFSDPGGRPASHQRPSRRRSQPSVATGRAPALCADRQHLSASSSVFATTHQAAGPVQSAATSLKPRKDHTRET